jgi:serine/threonine-protein kinase
VAYASASGGAGGTLRVNSRPWAQIFVDGRMMGNTPQLGMALPAGKHDVKLVNPLLGMSRKFSVRIQSGKIETKIVELIN